MVRLLNERVLLIGDARGEVQPALAESLPGVQVTAVATLFDGIAELAGGRFTTVLAAAEPLERRPEAAVRTLRELAGDARLLLFGHPTLEILSRKMMEFGCEDYLVTPADPGEFRQLFGKPSMRIARQTADQDPSAGPSEPTAERALVSRLSELPLAEMLLDAMLQHPADAVQALVNAISSRLAPDLALSYAKADQASATTAAEGRTRVSQAVPQGQEELGRVDLDLPAGEDEMAARDALSEIARLIGKVVALQERHNRLQRLAITDELTGLSNARYFRHFLSLILERAKSMHFPVTLLVFDIDDFKRYNDEFGHKTGDEILKQVAVLMKRCIRQHDLVARIGGDEFAVVFWDKEGPRQPRQPKPNALPFRPPQEPLQIFERFKGLISGEEFPSLGQTGKGTLTVSAGLAVFPWDATSVDALIGEADQRLMQGAKRRGKNTLYIVGTDDPTPPDQAGP